MDGWIDGSVDIDRWMEDTCTCRCMDGLMDDWMDEWMDGGQKAL